MTTQSPTISIPKKSTEEVDWTTPVRNLIAQSYGENPDNYTAECAALQRCRQDAVKGAGSDTTARDLLYKYFGQLELLELRFAEIRVTFPWHDAFTNKLTTQTSLAYEKASIIFQIAATHSAIAAAQNRGDPEGLKRAFHYFRTSAGMLTYINDNFLHAPSTDLSREVVKFLVSIMMAQATEVFYEKCVDERKGSGLVAKVANQAATMYTSLCEEVKEFMGKGIFDRNWVTILQIKAKYFNSLSQLHRALADNAAGNYGDALSRFTAAEAFAKDASKLAASFGGMFMPQMSPNLPPDAGSAIQELTKFHLALCTEKKNEAQKDNDLIYNAVVPPIETLPQLDKLQVAKPIPIQEVYSVPDVQKTIGPDIFIKLIPLSVHESASVYSEEKAKLVRAEVERADTAESEKRSCLDALGVQEGLGRYKAMVEGLHAEGTSELPLEVTRMREDISLIEEREPVTRLLSDLSRLRDVVHSDIDSAQRELEVETRDCEAMRVKYEHMFTQAPSAGPSRSLRQDLKSHRDALQAASVSDQQVLTLWDSVKGDVTLLLSDQLEDVFRQSADHGPGGSLLDLDPNNEDRDEEERAKITRFIDEIEQRLLRLNKISTERRNVLKDLKEKIQSDDVSHLLLLNRRNQAVEPALFAAELEKFKPFQNSLISTVQYEQAVLGEITQLWKGLKDLAGRGPGARKWEEREKRKKDTMRRFTRARDGYMEVRDGLAKGLQFYRDLTELCTSLRRNVKSFVTERVAERDALVAEAERQKNASAPPPLAEKPRPLATGQTPSVNNINSSFGSMNLRDSTSPPSRPPPPPSSVHNAPYSTLPPPPPRVPGSYSTPSPPQQASSDPYANMFSVSGLSTQFLNNGNPSPVPTTSPPFDHNQRSYAQTQYQPYSQQQPQYTQANGYGSQPQTRQQNTGTPFPSPPPPVPISYQQQQQYGGNAHAQSSPPRSQPLTHQPAAISSPFPPPPPQTFGQYQQSSYSSYPR
ncbi:BRO1-domain-containing protein [Fomitiporia mediterranea MF3/22]|uniref:BRO1-domain-containing protein n=1 Tax=Fomitiporia mediterranea (strain MF3/22) TaxID=694068 RepID=UPI00044098C0|nr:BRO1-domain-containing protein [Fomitiporia mediterranea MF3/22]EJD01878.1 BRO1-domain-containing protein [Fomitiporia mediterranea MF3/22]